MTCLGVRCIHAVADSKTHSECTRYYRPIELSHFLFSHKILVRALRNANVSTVVKLTNLLGRIIRYKAVDWVTFRAHGNIFD